MLPLTRFAQFVRQHNLFSISNRVLLAVSGGKDSVLMAHLFNESKIEFGIAHCNFKLRGDEADKDETFCRLLASQFNCPFYSVSFDTETFAAINKISIQMAARELRYNWLEEIRCGQNYTSISVAHHLSDSTETVLLNLVRGTGIQGLHGILPKNDRLVRPLLFLTRPEIDELIASNPIAYREDQSNASSKYARNLVRNQVIPPLKLLNPNLDETFSANSRRFADIEAFISLETAKLRQRLFTEERERWTIPIQELKDLPSARLFLFELFRPFNFSEEVLADLYKSLEKHSGRTFLSPTHRIVLDRMTIILEPLNPDKPVALPIGRDDEFFSYGNTKFKKHAGEDLPENIPANPGIACLDGSKLLYPLIIRGWKEGDSFYPLGMKGKKKLSDFFISQKVPLHLKAEIPVLENGNGDIVWVAGYRISERYKVSSQTKKVIIFESL